MYERLSRRSNNTEFLQCPRVLRVVRVLRAKLWALVASQTLSAAPKQSNGLLAPIGKHEPLKLRFRSKVEEKTDFQRSRAQVVDDLLLVDSGQRILCFGLDDNLVVHQQVDSIDPDWNSEIRELDRHLTSYEQATSAELDRERIPVRGLEKPATKYRYTV
jgi:hypothetical protein